MQLAINVHGVIRYADDDQEGTFFFRQRFDMHQIGHFPQVSFFPQQGRYCGGAGLVIIDDQNDRQLRQPGKVLLDHFHERPGFGIFRLPPLYGDHHHLTFSRHHPHRQRKDKQAALAWPALDPDGTALHLQQASHQRQPKSRAPELARQSPLDLDKGLKNTLDVCRFDANPAVPHPTLEQGMGIVALDGKACLDAPSIGRELDRVSDQVDPHLLQFTGIEIGGAILFGQDEIDFQPLLVQ